VAVDGIHSAEVVGLFVPLQNDLLIESAQVI